MRASYIMAAAVLLHIVGRWANNEKAVNLQTVAGGAFVILFIAALDHGATEDIAKGIALIFLAVVILAPDSPLTGIARAINDKRTNKPAAAKEVGMGGPPQ